MRCVAVVQLTVIVLLEELYDIQAAPVVADSAVEKIIVMTSVVTKNLVTMLLVDNNWINLFINSFTKIFQIDLTVLATKSRSFLSIC